MERVLLIEDDKNLGWSLQDRLEKEGYQVTWVQTLADAEVQMREPITAKPDILILDWMLPDGQGHDFLKRLRQQGIQTPVIFLTARVDLMDKILGLELGANDYITKPFETRELLARIRVQLRDRAVKSSEVRLTLKSEKEVSVGALRIDLDKYEVWFQDRPIHLVKKEFDLLALLAESPEKVFSRDEIMNKVWGYDVFPTTRTVDTHIMLLRQKLHENLIETVRSVGYKLKIL